MENVLPLPKTNLFRMGDASKAKRKKMNDNTKKIEFDPIFVELDLELQRYMCQRLLCQAYRIL
jgi:hypothetical protein